VSRIVRDARVVSLLPAASEIVCALGRGDRLVGRSHECDYPESVRSLPVCTRARFRDGSSREIDDRVADLRALIPDLLATLPAAKHGEVTSVGSEQRA